MQIINEINREVLDRMLKADLRTVITGFLVLATYLLVQGDFLTTQQQITSFFILLAPSVLRRMLVNKYAKRIAAHPSPITILRLYRCALFFSGLAWGLVFNLTFVPDNLASVSLNAITVAGLIGGACISYSIDRTCVIAFVTAALTFGLPNYFANGNVNLWSADRTAMTGILVILFVTFVGVASYSIGNLLQEFIRLRQIEKEDKNQIKALLEKQSLHMDQTPLGFIEWQADGRILSWNVAATKIFGYSPEEMIGKSLFSLFDSQHCAQLDHAITQLNTEAGGAYLKLKHLSKSQKTIYCEWFNTAIRDEYNNLISVASMVQDETAFVHAQNEVQRLAYYDPLTHLPNRRMLMDRLRQVRSNCVRNKSYSGLMFIDLDHFKEVNDAHGHDVGDQLLKNMSKRLQKVVRSGDTVARMGGDEFVILLADLGKSHYKALESCTSVANKMIQVLSAPFVYKQFTYPVTASLGISLIHHGMGAVEDVLRHADQAMYEAKAAGRNCMRFYEESLEEILDRKSMLKLALTSALQRQQLQVFYQPQIADNTLIGAESLLRWEHPELGQISPEEFIPLAEESGSIVSIGYWVLEQVCRQLQTWQQEGGCYITLSVNVSVMQFAQSDFVERVEQILNQYDFPNHLLKLELTESLMIHNTDEIVLKMRALKTLGLCLSLDDFGVGYSSLSVLKKLPLDELKIDRIFVQDILQNTESATISETIIAMGHKLNLSIIAEGVETEEQVRYLQELGCYKFQGYLYGKPCSIEAFNKLRLS